MADAALDTQDALATVHGGRSRTGLSSGLSVIPLSWMEMLGLADQALVSGGTFLATVAVGRWTNSQQLGDYSVGMTAMFSVVAIQRALVTLPFIVRRNKPENDDGGLGRHSFVQSGVLSASASACLVLVALALLVAQAHANLIYFVGALAWLAPCLLLREFARQFAFAHLRVAQALVVDATALVIQASGLLWLGVTGQLTAAAAYTANGVAFGVAGLGWLYLNRAKFHIGMPRFREQAWQNWVLGRWLLGSQVANSVQAFVASWLLASIDGPAAAGVYAACLALVGLASPLINGSSNMLLPRMTVVLHREGLAGLKHQALRDAVLLGTVMVGFCWVVTATSGTLGKLLYGNAAYAGQEHTVLVLALGLLATAIGIPAGNALTCVERPQALFGASVASAMANTVLGFWLITEWGVVGGAYGFLAGSLVGTIGRWAAFLPPAPSGSGISGSAREQVDEILHMISGTADEKVWTATSVGEGAQAIVFAVRPVGRQKEQDDGHSLAIKLYKPGITRQLALEQFEALQRTHSVLDGCQVGGWTFTVPKPIRLHDAPLALVMTMVPGRTLLRQLEEGGSSLMRCVAQALASGMILYWSRQQPYGDFNLDNILCDLESRTLAFVDAGIPLASESGEHSRQGWHPSSCDLAYLLYETTTTLRRSIGRIGAEKRKLAFVTEILRTILQTIPALAEKHRRLDEIQTCAHAYLMTLEGSLTPRGVWRSFLRRIATGRVEAVVRNLRSELDCAVAATTGGMT